MTADGRPETVVDIARVEDLHGLYGHGLVAAEEPGGGRLVVRLPEGRLGSVAAPVPVRVGATTGAGIPPLDLALVGPDPERPAILEGVTIQFSGRRLEIENVVLTGAPRAAIAATIGERLLLRASVVAGARIADVTQVAVVDVSVAPHAEGTVRLEDSWLVDNGGPIQVQGLLVRGGTGASATVALAGSGLLANAVVHDLVLDSTRQIELDRAVVVGPAEPRDTAGGVLLSPGTELVVRRSLVAPGAGRPLVDPTSGQVGVNVEDSTAAAEGEELEGLIAAGFGRATDSTAEGLAAAAEFSAEDAVSSAAIRSRLRGLADL